MAPLTEAQYFRAQQLYQLLADEMIMPDAYRKLLAPVNAQVTRKGYIELWEFIQMLEAGELDLEAIWSHVCGEVPKVDDFHQAVVLARHKIDSAGTLHAEQVRGLIELVPPGAELVALKIKLIGLILGSDNVDPEFAESGEAWDRKILMNLNDGHVEFCLRLDPANWELHKLRGVIFARLKYDPQEYSMRRALLLRPDKVELWDLGARCSLMNRNLYQCDVMWMMGCYCRHLESAINFGRFSSAGIHEDHEKAASAFMLAKEIDPDCGVDEELQREVDECRNLGLNPAPGLVQEFCHPAMVAPSCLLMWPEQNSD